MDPRLYKAAMEGDMELLTSIMEVDCPPDLSLCLTPQKNTALHIAVQFEQQEIVQRMIQLCPSLIYQQNSKGDTPLHVAARAGHVDLTKLLTPLLTEGNLALEEGNPVRQAGSVALRMSNLEGNNPIHEALKKGHEEVALHLLAFEERHGLAHDVNMARESLLYLAAEAGLEKVVQKIINTGDYSTQGPDGQNPLHIAIIKGQLGVVKILVDKEHNLILQADCFGNTVLHYASAKSFCRILEYNDKGRPWSQITYQSEKILECLLQANSTLAYVPNINGDYPLFFAIRKGFGWAIDIILDHCPDSAELVNQKGQNALHLAVMEKNWFIIWELTCRLEFKKLINEPDNDGNTPMHLVTQTNQEDIVWLLINEGSLDLTISNKQGLTAMDTCGYTETKVFKKLINEPNNHGNTPTHLATLINQEEIVVLLTDTPVGVADLTMSNKQGLTATDICGYTKAEHRIRDRLRSCGAVPSRQRWQERFPDLEDDIFQTKIVEISPEFKSAIQTLPVVTVLVATVTFAAAFTVPGGYHNDGPHEGLPVFMRNAALHAFVLSDILAFCSSMVATILLVYVNAHSEDAFLISSALKTCYYISGVAIVATITAFVTAVYVLTSKESLWLAVTSLLLGSVVPLFLFWYRKWLESRRPRPWNAKYLFRP